MRWAAEKSVEFQDEKVVQVAGFCGQSTGQYDDMAIRLTEDSKISMPTKDAFTGLLYLC